MRLEEDLNKAQKEAVLHKDGPLLIIAGAGAGKTRTIIHRVLNLIENGIEPANILAVTFTNKAALEMKERISNLLREKRIGKDMPGEEPFISTFHSLCLKILRENSRELGLPTRFTIFDENDSLSAMQEAVKENGFDPKQFEPRRLKAVISRLKGDLIDLGEYITSADSYFPKVVAKVWEGYEKILRREKALDFDDIILKTVRLFEKKPDILSHYQERFKYIHVDEYQDTNQAQYKLVKLLAEKYKNVCVVGDSDQNIYSWRGANLRNILNFEKDYPGAKTVFLEENYRSTKVILSAANAIISKNKIRKKKKLFTNRETGQKISLYSAYDETDEARFVSRKSKELIENGVPPEEIAVLYRANFQSRALEEAFLNEGVPYQVLGTRFFERKEIKDILSYLKASMNPESLSDLRRIINLPPRGIGKATIVKVFSGKRNELPGKIKDRLSAFFKILKQISEAVAKKKASEAVKLAVRKSGLEKLLLKGGDEDKERFENIMELVTLATRYDHIAPPAGIEKLLDDVALASDQDSIKEKGGGVKLMTAHASKGLEFKHVFVTGLEDELFPHQRLQTENISEEDAEEERRLFYVAITRAKEKLYLSFTETRTIYGLRKINSPSEFISDIAAELVTFEKRLEPPYEVIRLD